MDKHSLIFSILPREEDYSFNMIEKIKEKSKKDDFYCYNENRLYIEGALEDISACSGISIEDLKARLHLYSFASTPAQLDLFEEGEE